MIEQFNGSERVLKVALYLCLSAIFLVAGHFLVIQRHADAEIDWYQISPDAKIYISMAEGSETKLPFSRRILVPFIASMIPDSSVQSLRIVTYFSLFMFYFLSFLSLDLQNFNIFTQVSAVLVIFCCTAHLLLFQNPHIVDAFCHMCSAFMLLFLLRAVAFPYGMAAVAGVLAHEMALFSVPSFLATGRWRASFSIIALSVGVFVGTHVLIGGDSLLYKLPPFKSMIFIEAYFAWGVVWVPIVAGLLLCRKEFFIPVSAMFIFSIFGAIISSIVARGAVRMFTAIIPVAVVLVAYYLAEVRNMNATLFVILVVFLCFNVFIALPIRIAPVFSENLMELEEFYFRLKYPLLVFHAFGIAMNFAIIYRMRNVICANTRENFQVAFERIGKTR